MMSDIVSRLLRLRFPDLKFPKPIDRHDDDYLIVWSLAASSALFTVFMFICWWMNG